MVKSKRFFTLTRMVSVSVMIAFAVFGRIAFAAIPNFKPTTAIVILSGLAFGPATGFLTGALSALLSNFYFGQGLWTPVQMLAWGLIGLLSGLLTNCKFMNKLWKIAAFGLFSALLYGIMLDTWHVLFFVKSYTLEALLATAGASALFNFSHALSTVLFLVFLAMPFLRRAKRIRLKYMDLEG